MSSARVAVTIYIYKLVKFFPLLLFWDS